MTIDQIDLFIFHQASKIALDFLTRMLKIKPEKTFRNIRDIGNTVSASIPIALKDALESGKVSRGDKVLLSGFGVGLSWGSIIMEI
jgi:3-oxoacyl-[acyl-carrier-protein] synthase-3